LFEASADGMSNYRAVIGDQNSRQDGFQGERAAGDGRLRHDSRSRLHTLISYESID
jgi:hypothetical protein